MEGFKPNVKMKSDISCYKEGGYVFRKKHSEEKEESKDIAKDKAMIKKAVGQHEGAKHKGQEKTELKLKTGRRVKKTGGVVNKYKTGGVCNPMKTGGVTNAMKDGGSCYKEGGAISMKMDKEDRKKVASVKKTKAAKASAPSAAAKKSKEPIGYSDGRNVDSKRYTYGEINGIPVTEEQMRAAEAAELARPKSQSELELEEFANRARGNMNRPGQSSMGGLRFQKMPGYADGSSVGTMRAGRQDDMSNLLEDAAKAVQGSQGGMGAAAATGGMGNAYPMGAEEDLIRGLRAVGRAMGGRV